MLIGERRLKVMELLEEKGNVVVWELSSLLSVTEETIRRDLESLEKEGLLKRIAFHKTKDLEENF